MSYYNLQLHKFESPDGNEMVGHLDLGSGDSRKGVVFVHGFKGSTVNVRTRRIIDEISDEAATLQFDFSGGPLYSGDIKDFQEMTIERSVGELKAAINTFRERCSLKEITLVSHSLGGCVVLQLLSQNPDLVDKLVFLSPGFNQTELMRYWFTQQTQKEMEITWDNFRSYFSEEEFQKDISQEVKKVGEYYISTEYFQNNQDKDYQDLLEGLNVTSKNILIVYGTEDKVVPPDSNDRIPEEIEEVKVAGGHDLDDPDVMKSYLSKLVSFITEEK